MNEIQHDKVLNSILSYRCKVVDTSVDDTKLPVTFR